ncbi:putative MATE family efflux protein [Lachnotalea glycerini]|uniref:Probable multidrug resistance protein NorM n=1 Tax=Lachnotalea glycerini TaxID=1763509 RepID=A0A318EG85_9FIRM|nr:MATE family efflux transporter [Lachnotalea glycerini]PXV84733.1 putative MATE family efflux protein [Lachnotalea glycerini]
MLFDNKALKRLIIPLIIEQILAITVGMADTMMISRAGEAAISGVSLVDMINNLLINVFAAISTGGAVVTSQYIGKKRKDLACSSAKQLIYITVLISLGIMVLTIVFRIPLLNLLFGTIDHDVMKNAITYLIISAISYPCLALYNSCAALFRSTGNSKISMQISLGMNIINVIGNAIFIFHFNMGVAGAALASLIARSSAAVIMLILSCNSQNEVYIDHIFKLEISTPIIKKILNIGIPNGFENSIFQLGRVVVVSIISYFGTVQIAANAVANNLDAMGCIAGVAMNLAMITVVGQCVGAGDYKQAVYYTKKVLKLTYVITICINIVILITMPLILSIYDLSPETLELATILIFIHDGIAMILWPASFTLPNALRASNDVKFTMYISVFSMCMFRILLSYILGKHYGMGAIGVWIAMVVDWMFRATCFIGRFVSGKWKLQKI